MSAGGDNPHVNRRNSNSNITVNPNASSNSLLMSGRFVPGGGGGWVNADNVHVTSTNNEQHSQ